MAITIDGSANTIAGLAVGGLPDGTIDNGCMADDAIAIADLAATGTPSSSTFLRGDNAWAAAGGGKILQVVSTTKTDTESNSTAVGAWWTTGLTRAITPSAATSKVWVIGTISAVPEDSSMAIGARLVYDSDTLITGAIGDTASDRGRATVQAGNSGSDWCETLNINYLHSPSTTSEITYKVRIHHTKNGTMILRLNYSANDSDNNRRLRLTSTLTCVEIGA